MNLFNLKTKVMIIVLLPFIMNSAHGQSTSSLTLPSTSTTGNYTVSWSATSFDDQGGDFILISDNIRLQALGSNGRWSDVSNTNNQSYNVTDQASGTYSYRLIREYELFDDANYSSDSGEEDASGVYRRDYEEAFVRTEASKSVVVSLPAPEYDIPSEVTSSSNIDLPAESSNGSYVVGFNTFETYTFDNGITYDINNDEASVVYSVMDVDTGEAIDHYFSYEYEGTSSVQITINNQLPGTYEYRSSLTTKVHHEGKYQRALQSDSGAKYDDFYESVVFVDDEARVIQVFLNESEGPSDSENSENSDESNGSNQSVGSYPFENETQCFP